MARQSKRAKPTTLPPATTSDGADSGGLSARPQLPISFQTGPTLERIPDDVLYEIISHLPTLDDRDVEFELVRSPTLRALSWTSRILRSRCLAMAWRNVEFCGTRIPKRNVMIFRAIGDATMTGIRVLKESPHLLPLIQTVSVIMTRYRSAEIIPELATCLATLPNLTTIQVIHAHSQMMTAIKNGFEGTLFPSVRRISLPSSAHAIIKSCPNVEQVMCTDGDGSTIIGSLIKGDCRHVRILRGISAPRKRLAKLLPNVKHIGVTIGGDMTELSSFSLLETIEIDLYSGYWRGVPLDQAANSEVEEARKILKGNKSQGEKTVILTQWHAAWDHARFEFDASKGCMRREVIKV